MSPLGRWRDPNWCRFTKEDRNQLVESIHRYYSMKKAKPVFYTPILEYFAGTNQNEKRLNHKSHMIQLLQDRSKQFESGGHRVFDISIRTRRIRGGSRISRTRAFLKEIPLLPHPHTDILDRVASDPLSSQLPNFLIFQNLYSLENSAYMELFATFLCSNLVENNSSPHFARLYGHFTTVFPRFSYRDISSVSSHNPSTVSNTVSNCPVHVVATEYIPISLLDCLDKCISPPDLEDRLRSVFFQVTAALSIVQSRYHLIHNDLHLDNIMCRRTRKQWLWYKTDGGDYYRVPTYGYVVTLIDWGRCTLCFRSKQLWNRCFDMEYEVFGQYYRTLPGRRSQRDPVSPNASFDLTLFTQCILREFHNKIPSNTKWYQLLCNICQLSNGTSFHDSVHVLGFQTYVDIARYAYDAVPLQLIQDSCFHDYQQTNPPSRETIYEIE